MHNEELAGTLELFGREGAAPFYGGEIGQALADWVVERGGLLTREDLRDYAAIPRVPARVRYRDREVLTNPPPSAGGILLAYSLGRLHRRGPPPAAPARRPAATRGA